MSQEVAPGHLLPSYRAGTSPEIKINKDWDGKCIWLKSWGRSCGWLSFRARCRLEGGLGDEECSRSHSQPGFPSRCLVQTQGSQLWLSGEDEPALCSALPQNMEHVPELPHQHGHRSENVPAEKQQNDAPPLLGVCIRRPLETKIKYMY